MKTKSTLGIAVLLATLVLLQPLAACVAMFEPTEAAHACCRKNIPPPSSKTDCCVVSSAPPDREALPAATAMVWGIVPASGEPSTELNACDPTSDAVVQLAASHLFIRFHQLLI
jgi:hypothetical protein